jgi:hypothetical protein
MVAQVRDLPATEREDREELRAEFNASEWKRSAIESTSPRRSASIQSSTTSRLPPRDRSSRFLL